MASSLGSLVKDTAWYGLSTIVGRFLNWLLVPFYVRVLETSGDYGIVTNLYAWTALLLVVLTYGMETGFFRFMNGDDNPSLVYRTSLRSLFVTSLLFFLGVCLFSRPISQVLLGREMPSTIVMMGFIIATDAFMSIPYAYLRYRKRSVRFAAIKLTFVGVNIGLNLFFLLLCPYLYRQNPDWISRFYNPEYGVEYIFLSNLLANVVVLLMLIPSMRSAFRTPKKSVSKGLLSRMLRYSLPLVLLGIAGIFNQMADKILFPFLFEDKAEAMAELGIYGACFKIAVVMVLFTQAFRYAFEPFLFEKSELPRSDESKRKNLAKVTHYFWLFMLIVFLAVVAFLDILKYFVVPEYYKGLSVVPWILWGEMMMGIALNLSTWYKLTNHTIFGAIISLAGCIIGVLLMLWGVPRFGFISCAWAVAISNTFIVVLSYILGQKYYPIPYKVSQAFGYLLVAGAGYLVLVFTRRYSEALGGWQWLINVMIPLLFTLFIFLREPDLRNALSRAFQKLRGNPQTD